jgi:hypothetical protein
METKEINLLYDLFCNIFTSLSNILSSLNNLGSTYCTIFILVTITLLGLVLFANNASVSPEVRNLLDTQTDFEERVKDNKIPLNLVYVPYGAGSRLLIDKNDETGIRVRTQFFFRAASLVERGGYNGFVIKKLPNDQGELLVNTNTTLFTEVEASRGVLTRGAIIDRELHLKDPLKTVIKVLRDV